MWRLKTSQLLMPELRGAPVAPPGRADAVGVDQHAAWLPERSHHILRVGQIHAHFATDAAVDMRKQRGRDLEESQAASERGGDEAGHVADHAAAERDDHRLAVGPAAQHLVPLFPNVPYS